MSRTLNDIQQMTPLERLCYWIQEREMIRVQKEMGAPKPWTDDSILQTYRFCNVRRMDDKVSQWLLNHWYTRYRAHPNMLYACALARFFNKPESLALITDKVFREGKSSDWSGIKKVLRKYRDGGGTVFNGAYMIRGNDGCDKIECVVDYYVKPLSHQMANWQSYCVPMTMQRVHEELNEQYGFGSFMAGQVVADLRWAVVGPWNDKGYWAPIGPGSKRGMNRLLSRDISSPLPQEEFLENLQDMIADCCKLLPEHITSRLEAIDWQNTLCESDKYNRVLFGEGKPKQLYPGV